MASIQKSFFEQTNEHRPRWHNRRNLKHVKPPLIQVAKVIVGPVIPASSQSKKKLEAFRYSGPTESDTKTNAMASSVDQENIGVGDEKTRSQRLPRSFLPAQQGVINAESYAPPKTPVTRVPLSQLISNGEDGFEHMPILTPVERVLWDNSPTSLRTPVGRRGTKRARSSSPQSSSQHEAAAYRASPNRKASFDLQTLQNSLTTPLADPASDLWNRYAVNSIDKQTPSKAVTQPLPNLLHSSSPQTPARYSVKNDNSGLRRTMSCGIEWPTSVAKRRKIHKSYSQVVDKGNATSITGFAGHDAELNVSKVQFLLEKLNDGLTCQSGHQHETRPSSSSPPTLNSACIPDSTPSPSKRPLINSDVATASRSAYGTQELPLDSSMFKVSVDAKAVLHTVDQDASSDYGGDAIDLDFVGKIDATARATNPVDNTPTPVVLSPSGGPTVEHIELGEGQRSQATKIETIIKKQDVVIKKCNVKDVHNSMIASGISTTNAKDEDNFDDDDDDELFAADLENIAAMYDEPISQENMQNNVSNGNLKKDPTIIESGSHQGQKSKASTQEGIYVEVSSDDEFGEGLELEELASELTRATQAVEASFSSINEKIVLKMKRYVILTIVTDQYETDKGHKRPEKILFVNDEETKSKKIVVLRQSWFDSSCTPGSYIHVIGSFDKGGQCIIDDTENMLILHPDHLISATVVADSFSCTRRAVLQDRVKATNESNEPQVYGHILHEIFQEAMRSNRWDTEWLTTTIETIASRYLETLFEINVDMTRAVQHLISKVPQLQSWAEVFVTAQPRPDALIKDRNGAQALMSVNKLLDVEEHVWSPMYGLKGNVDATVQVVMKDGEDERTLTVPFEVKTGKNNSNPSHKAQTALYTLLLSDRYDIEIAYGILYYMETSEISRIPALRHELRHMIIQRNELACYVRQRLELPPMLKSPHLCGKCYAKTPCFIYHKLIDNGDGSSSGMKEKFDELVNHLLPAHQEFFRKWDHLLTKEETDILKFRRELWTMLSSERERVGRCFGNVVIEPGSAMELTDAPKINRFRYTFVKQKASPAFSFTDSQITTGEPIVISDEKGHFALANGYVTRVRRHRITVAVDRRLHNARVRSRDFHPQNNQSFTGIMEVIAVGERRSTMTPRKPEEQVLYRLDKDEFSNGMATVRNNLICVMEKDLFSARSLRKLVVEAVAPTFVPKPPMNFDTASQSSLNIDQRNAIEKVMSAKDYALVLGMPGTGKTTTIAHIIRALAAQGKSILLTSYTHTAVDNILLKIRNDGIGILRLGAVAKVHPEVQEFAELASVPKTSVEELKHSYSKQVVATTCLGINHPIFNQRTFDYCIVDEASQITLPVCLGPIRMARTFILVGDHYQLPPLVQNKEAQEGGLDISLFKFLSDKHPSSVVNLEHQYRMCADIMSLSNTLIYSGRLKCGTPVVAAREIVIPNLPALRTHHYSPSNLPPKLTSFCPGPLNGSCWLASLLSPSIKVAFVNTDPLLPLSREIAKGSRITNSIEATLTTQLVEALLTVGVPAADIGVITLYRSQLALLKQLLRTKSSVAGHADGAAAVEMHTADRFQGRDKDVVVLSLVRSNEVGNVGDLLKDWRRVNVALTRARTKLVIVGSWDTVRRGSELLGKMCELVEGRGWRVDLGVCALDGHLFEDGVTQGSLRSERGVEREDTVEKNEKEVKPRSKGLGPKPEKKGREPEKKGTVDIRSLLNKRPVMRDIVNEARA